MYQEELLNRQKENENLKKQIHIAKELEEAKNKIETLNDQLNNNNQKFGKINQHNIGQGPDHTFVVPNNFPSNEVINADIKRENEKQAAAAQEKHIGLQGQVQDVKDTEEEVRVLNEQLRMQKIADVADETLNKANISSNNTVQFLAV